MLFFGDRHFLVSLADQTEASSEAWDMLLYDDRSNGSLTNSGYSKGQSGTFDKDYLWREEIGFSNVLYIPSKGNHFNVLFYNGAMLFFLYDNLKHLFESVKDENKLHKSYLYGC